jgi:hypothetical protein
MQSSTANQQISHRLTRRQFLYTFGLAATASWVAACAPRTSGLTGVLGSQATPQIVLPSPVPPAGTATAAAGPGDLPLEAFLQLSAVLTGVTNLSPLLGQVYLQSLQASSKFAVTLAELYEQAGFTSATPTTIEELEAKGLFEQEPTRQLADKIIEYWYTGIYDSPAGEQAVATFVDALAWQTLVFTKPLTICSAPGVWSEAPEPVVD